MSDDDDFYSVNEKVWSFVLFNDENIVTDGGYALAPTIEAARVKIRERNPDKGDNIRIVPSAMSAAQYYAAIARMKAKAFQTKEPRK